MKARISVLSAALRENHEWHQQHDEHGGYSDSTLEATNTNALIGAVAEWKLPCEIRLPGGMTIGKGCSLNTLLLAIRRRADALPWQQDFNVPIPIDSGLGGLLQPLPDQPQGIHSEGGSHD